MGFQVFDFRQLFELNLVFDNTYAGGYLSVVTPAPQGIGLQQILCVNSDSVDHVVTLAIGAGSDSFVLTSVKVPHGAGFDGVTSAVDLVASIPGFAGLFTLFQGQAIWLKCDATPLLTSVVNVTFLGGQY